MRRSSFEVRTTNGILFACIVPSFGMLSCHTLNNSSKRASNAWSTLSNSSISRTQGSSRCNARKSGPALKNCWPCNSACRDSQSTVADFGSQFNAKPLERLIELADGLLFVDALVALQALHGCMCRLGDCVGQLRLTAACRPFQ